MIKNIRNNRLLQLILLGLLCALPFTFENLFFISWFSFVPFFLLIIKDTVESVGFRRLFWKSFVFFMSYHLGIYYFFFSLVPLSFMGIGYIGSVLLMAAGWIALSLFHSIPLAFAVALTAYKVNNRIFKSFAMSLTIVLIQFVLSLGAFGFTWARLSLPQCAFLPLIQSSSLFGPYFIDLLLMLVNTMIVNAILSNKSVKWVACAVAVFTLNLVFGLVWYSHDYEVKSEKTVVAVQGNVLMDKKWGMGSSYSIYMNETKTVEDKNSLIVWTETAVTAPLNKRDNISSTLMDYTSTTGNDLITGAFYLGENGREYNAAYYFSSGKLSNTVYMKRRMVPFGEYLPFRELLEKLPFLDGFNLSSSDLYPGNSSKVLETSDGQIGCLICFDSIFNYFARDSVQGGAELLVVMTNDSWYKDHPAVYQHKSQSVWRAVENGRYLVRAANSGVTAFVAPNGKTLSYLPPLEKGTLSHNVGFISDKTLYTIIGDVIILPIFLFCIACFIPNIKKLLQKRRSLKNYLLRNKKI